MRHRSATHRCIAERSWLGMWRWSALAVALLAHHASAAEGCLVMLCLAAPSWSSIAQCVDPVHQVLHDLARGRPFPSCDSSGGSSRAQNSWSSPPAYCPPQYTHSFTDAGTFFTCDYDGAIEVLIDGALWSRTWWHLWGGDTVTEFTPAAKARLGSWDTRFEDDYARWLASAPPPCTTC